VCDPRHSKTVWGSADYTYYGRTVIGVPARCPSDQPPLVLKIFMAILPSPFEISYADVPTCTPDVGPGDPCSDPARRQVEIALVPCKIRCGGGRWWRCWWHCV